MKVYDPSPSSSTANIFLNLLRIYLTPESQSLLSTITRSSSTSSTTSGSSILLKPALELIQRHSPRLDAFKTLHLLPPLVTAKELREFLMEVLKQPRFDTAVRREIGKSWSNELSMRLVALQGQRVTVTDTRVCVIHMNSLIRA
jgi:hypothetical protein